MASSATFALAVYCYCNNRSDRRVSRKRRGELRVIHSWYHDIAFEYNPTLELQRPILFDLYLEYPLHRYWLTTFSASLGNFFQASRDKKLLISSFADGTHLCRFRPSFAF